jgi:hypothetical protein
MTMFIAVDSNDFALLAFSNEGLLDMYAFVGAVAVERCEGIVLAYAFSEWDGDYTIAQNMGAGLSNFSMCSGTCDILPYMLSRFGASKGVAGYSSSVSNGLHAAVIAGDVNAVRALVTNGAAHEAKALYGRSALVTAAVRGELEIVEIILEAQDGFPGMAWGAAIGEAANHGHDDLVRFLLDYMTAAAVNGAPGVAIATALGCLNTAILAADMRGDKHIAKLIRAVHRYVGKLPAPEAEQTV